MSDFTPHSLLLTVNLGVFGADDSRPNMMDIQNKVNAEFSSRGVSLDYNRAEYVDGDNTEVVLFFLYGYRSGKLIFPPIS